MPGWHYNSLSGKLIGFFSNVKREKVQKLDIKTVGQIHFWQEYVEQSNGRRKVKRLLGHAHTLQRFHFVSGLCG